MRFALLALLPSAALAIVAGGWALRWRAAHEPALVLDLLPPEGVVLQLASWSDLFQALYAIVPSRLKRLLFGTPWLSFEFWATEDGVRIRCWMPARLRTVVTTQLQSALPGLEIREAEADPELPAIATRSRLHLHRDPLYPLGNPRPEPLIAVVNTLARTRQGMFQLVVQPDERWQSQAIHRLDVLGGLSPAPFTFKSFLAGTLDFVFDLVLRSPATSAPTRPKPSHANPMPPAAKAAQPGYRAELRMRVSASTKSEAKAGIHSLAAAFRRFDAANGLRPKRVWIGRQFDRSVSCRKPPGRRADVLVPEELAGLFHLPIATESIDAAPVSVAPPRLGPEGDKVMFASDGPDQC